MPVPNVKISELQNALSILPSGGVAVCVVGPASAGPFNTPAAFGAPSALLANFPQGPGPELAAFILQRYGVPVLFCRTNQSVAGSFLNAVAPVAGSVGDITKTGTGTSAFTNDGASVPAIAASVYVLFNVGGTRGTPGIVYQVSLNNGLTFGPPQALGSATSFAIGGGTGVTIDVGAGTVVTGDFIQFAVIAPIVASAGTVVIVNPGTAALTIDGAATVDDDYQAFIVFPTGGTQGVAGIFYQWSLDGGRTLSPLTALGTATSITVPTSGGVKVNIGAGTILSGETMAFTCVAPCWNNTDLALAVQACTRSAIPWEMVLVEGPLTPAAGGVIDLNIDGKKHAWMGRARIPVGTESDATYQASLAAQWASFSTIFGELCAGACETVSAINGRAYMRSAFFELAPLECSVSAEVDMADPNLGPLTTATLTGADGNNKYHDEKLNPGLSDIGFSVLRTWDEFPGGVYPNLPLLFAPEGDDFDIMPKRRVMNIAHSIMRPYFARRLAKTILADNKTGFIKESTAIEIENGGTKALLAGLKGKVSNARVVVSRTDALLQNAPVTGQYRLTPLIYPTEADLVAGFENPALSVVGG